MKTLIIGATGLIGSKVIAASGDRPLSVLIRRDVAMPAQVEKHVADPADWPQKIAAIKPACFVSALGTTRAKAPDAKDFLATEYDLPMASARAARAAGAQHMIVVSSVGASSAAWNFYLKTKGRIEDELRQLGFARLDILRPGLLIGARGEVRPGEAMAQRLAPLTDALMIGPMRRYRSITAETVAAAIWALSAKDAPGVFVHEHDGIVALAD